MSASLSITAATLWFFVSNFYQTTAITCYESQATSQGITVVSNERSSTDYACGVVYDLVCSPTCQFITSYKFFPRTEAACAQNQINLPQCIRDANQQLYRVSVCCATDGCTNNITTQITPAACPPLQSNTTITTITTTTTTTTRLTAPPATFTTTTAASTSNSTVSSNNSTTTTKMPSAPSNDVAATPAQSIATPTTSSSQRVDGSQMVLFLDVAALLIMYIASNIL